MKKLVAVFLMIVGFMFPIFSGISTSGSLVSAWGLTLLLALFFWFTAQEFSLGGLDEGKLVRASVVCLLLGVFMAAMVAMVVAAPVFVLTIALAFGTAIVYYII